jgi:hypothetical protein
VPGTSKSRGLLEEHAKRINEKLDEHHLSMAKLLGVTDKTTADALTATPGDRQLDAIP